MEEDAKAFLIRVVRTITIGLVWLLINMTAGIYIGLMFFVRSPSIANIIFYCWFVASLIFMIRMFYKIWTEHKNNTGDDQV